MSSAAMAQSLVPRWDPARAVPAVPGTPIYALDAQLRSLPLSPADFSALGRVTIATHSYLDGIDLDDERSVVDRLEQGECRDAAPCNGAMTLRFSREAAAAFFRSFRIVHHSPNDATGFSATLFQIRASKQFVLGIRGAETLKAAGELDITRDREAVKQLTTLGLAMAQVVSARALVDDLRMRVPGLQESEVTLTGMDLGGHVSMVLMLMYPTQFRLAFVHAPLPYFRLAR